LTIITNSALIAMEVGRNRALRVVCFGGDYDPDSLAFIGPTSEEAAGKYYVDMAFFSTKGFIPDEGTFESSAANFRIKQIIARQAKRNVLLVDYTKFGQRSLCKVLDISQIHTVVTDTRAPASTLRLLREGGREVLMSAGSEKK
jgi:DeoR/GlpR family transcriptional regulator of sugar metabolism